MRLISAGSLVRAQSGPFSSGFAVFLSDRPSLSALGKFTLSTGPNHVISRGQSTDDAVSCDSDIGFQRVLKMAVRALQMPLEMVLTRLSRHFRILPKEKLPAPRSPHRTVRCRNFRSGVQRDRGARL